jgi:hypothetical protein
MDNGYPQIIPNNLINGDVIPLAESRTFPSLGFVGKDCPLPGLSALYFPRLEFYAPVRMAENWYNSNSDPTCEKELRIPNSFGD